MKQVDRTSTSQGVNEQKSNLTLYDRYGSMAYGVILRIIPDSEQAQAVLVDVFSLLQLKAGSETFHEAAEIIRLARTKALAARPTVAAPNLLSIPAAGTNDNLAKVVFELSFCQGYSSEAIAEKLHLSRTTVLQFLFAYFKDCRSS